MGEGSFYFRWTEGAGVLYGIYFVRGPLGILVNLLGPPEFQFYSFTSSLAQRLAAK